jgi:hypothetical protein
MAVAGFFVGFFAWDPSLKKNDENIEIVQIESVETEPVEIEETLKKFYASILHEQEGNFQNLLNVMKKDCSLPRGTTPLSFAIEQKKYSFGQILLRSDFKATLQDLQKAQFLQSLETDPIKKDQATIFVNFLTQHLQENNILPNSEPMQRGKDGAALATDSSNASNSFKSVDYQFIQATEKGDVASMTNLIRQGANPNAIINCIRPLDISIAHGQLGSLEFLLNQNITVTREDIEKAAVYQRIHATNEDCLDRYCEKGVNKQEAFLTETRIRQRVFDRLVTHARRQTEAAATLSRDKKA